jgi:hypothetical protein
MENNIRPKFVNGSSQAIEVTDVAYIVTYATTKPKQLKIGWLAGGVERIASDLST